MEDINATLHYCNNYYFQISHILIKLNAHKKKTITYSKSVSLKIYR